MRTFLLIPLSISVLVLSGCSGMPVATSTTTESVPGAALRGIVHGGQNPVSGAHVYLLAVNFSVTSTYGGPGIAPSTTNASASLLNSSVLSQTPPGGMDSNGNYYVTTDANGNWSITGDYTCPSSYAHPYIYAVGGNAGSGNNSAATLVGPVSSCNSSEFVTVNEVSTIAAVYAFAGFASDPLHVSSSNSSLAATNLNNATNAILNLENPQTGVALTQTPAGNGVVPQTTINTLANILAACVNSTGPGSSPCSTLFSNAVNGSTAPTDTTTAALNIAHNPGANVSALYGLQTATSPFQPMLSTVPNDFLIGIAFTGGGLLAPQSIAIDTAGNIWLTDQNRSQPSQSLYISEFSPAGAALSPLPNGYSGGGLDGPAGIAIDGNGHVWVANAGSITPGISEFSSSGSAISGSSGIIGGGLNTPYQVAIDKSNDVWITNLIQAGPLSEFNSSGSPLSGSTGYSTGSYAAAGIASDTSGNMWVADYLTTGSVPTHTISEFGPNGTQNTNSPYTGGGLDGPVFTAIDASGNVWATNEANNSLSEFSSSGSPISSSTGYTGGGLNEPGSLAIDGAGNVWVANQATGDIAISEFNSSGTAISGSSGYKGPFDGEGAIAIDGDGNIWVASTFDNALIELVGAASPVVTPIAANLMSPYGSHAVNLP